ncbi:MULTISPECIES: DUF6350 family protein [Microbacterium]|uniref:cell division protein PerM n=1 Tax=Microbacterium TaxID=33882 RepID=UPI00146DA72C|nr:MULTISPECIES: DUF6350 family protein [Microbacterium]
MHRLTVALLAAVDAAIAVAVGIAATLAPLTLLWVFGLGESADWNALWPAAVTAWQFGNLVPMLVTLPAGYIAAVGIDPAAASFTLSLCPLAFAAFTAIFAARSGIRASRAEAWATGVGTGAVVFIALAALAGFTGQNLLADTELWQAILFPTLVFALPALVAAVVTEWREAGAGAIARLRDRVEAAPHGWGEVPSLTARGTAVVLVGLIGLGALLTAAALLLRGADVIALFQAGNVDGLGATVMTLAQLAYLPTMAVWGMAFAAGPGVVLGDGGAVSPSGTQVGVVPGIPILGALPESTSPWLLLLALVPVALGAFAGWIARSRLVAGHPPPARDRTASGADGEYEVVLPGLLAQAPIADVREDGTSDHDPFGARLVVAAGIAVLSGAGAALLCAVASGSMGPGRLAFVGPEAGPVALAVGLEVLVGAAILLLLPRGARGRADDRSGARSVDRWRAPDARAPRSETDPGRDRADAESPADSGPGERWPAPDASPDLSETLDLGPRGAEPRAPLD